MRDLTFAILLATRAHEQQERKATPGMPYIVHPMDVLDRLTRHGGFSGNELRDGQIMAVLHDTVEDTEVTESQIERSFGDTISVGVLALSKSADPTYSREESLRENLERILDERAVVGGVKLADRASNLGHPLPEFWTVEKQEEYLKESEIVLATLGHTSDGLSEHLMNLIELRRSEI